MLIIKIHGFILACLLCTLSPLSWLAADNLADVLRTHKWDRIVDTWVDAGSQGKFMTLTYAW